MKTAKVSAILLFLLFALALPAIAMAAVIGKITAIEGDVDVLKPGMERAAPAALQQPISEGDIVRTKSNAKAEITFVDDSVIRLAPGSRLQITEYLMEGSKRKSGIMNLFRGKVRAVVAKSRGFLGVAFGGGDRFEVRTPTAVAGVKGTDFFVFYNMGVTGIVVKDGNVDVFNPHIPNQVIPVNAGNATFISEGAPPSAPRPSADVEVIRHTNDTDPGEKPEEQKNEPSTITASVDALSVEGTFGYEAPEGEIAPPPTDTETIAETPVEIPSSESQTVLLSSDTLGPAITVSGPSQYTNLSTASFTVTFDEPVTATYSMGAWGTTATATTSDTFSIASLPEGSYTLTITATDAAGNSTSQTYSWITDYTAAVVAFTSTPAATTNANTANFGLSSSETVAYSYTLDGASVGTTSLAGLTEGSHIFTVTATDGAGNTSTTSYTWMTDYTAPTVSITPVYASPLAVADSTVNINLSSNETSSYSYSLDGGTTWISTGTSLILSPLTEGAYTLDIQATDMAGNPSAVNTLSFDLSRYSLNGNFWGCIGNVTGSATGEVAGVSNQNWGSWYINMAGTGNLVPNPTWTLYAGGQSTDTITSNSNGYWIEVAPGSSDFGAMTLSGTSTFKYLSYDRLGIGIGTVTGSYSDSGLGYSNYSLTDSGAGTYTEMPLAWSGEIDYDYNDWGLYDNGDGILGRGDTYGGLAGGTLSPWSGTTSLTLMGPYWGPSSTEIGPFMWNAPIYSWNVNTSQYLTYDGGAFWGLTGGMWWDKDNSFTTTDDRTINARIYSLYIDPLGNAGILRGSLIGAYYPELGMFSADGTWTPTILATGLVPSTLGSLTYSPDFTWSTFGLAGTGSFTAGGSISEGQTEGLKYSMPGTAPGEGWGVWQALTAGDYSETSSDTWKFSFNDVTFAGNIIGAQTDGYLWSNSQLAGKTLGYGADITNTPMTWISVGETIGTFDANAFTWQAIQAGAWLDTNKFLAMTQTAQGQAALTALNIPFAEVGRANLSGSGNNMNVNMNDVTFFAYQTGAAPKIWATGNVNGTYTAPPVINTPVALTGNGLSADFTPKVWNTTSGNWMSTVNGGGTYTGTGTMNNTAVQMTGAAAGTITPATTSFSGTAAGTAK